MVDTSTTMGKPPIAIVGAGRAGSTLALALHRAGYPIAAVWSRTPAHATELAGRTGSVAAPLPKIPRAAALTLVAVSDDSIAEVAAAMAPFWIPGRMAVH